MMKTMKEIHLVISVDSLGTFQSCNNADTDFKENINETEKVSINTKCPECCYSLEIILHKTLEIKEEPCIDEEIHHPETFVALTGYDPNMMEPKIEIFNDRKINDDDDDDDGDSHEEEETSGDDQNDGVSSDEGSTIPVKTFKASDSNKSSVQTQGLKCLTCEKNYTKSKKLFDHLKNFHRVSEEDIEDGEVDKLTCNTCSRTFKSERTLKYHVKQVHRSESNEEAENSRESTGRTRTTKKKRHLTKAQKAERDRLWAEERAKNPPIQEFPKEGEVLCKVCNKMFISTAKLKAHLRTSHNVKEGKRVITNPYVPEPGEFLCRNCNREFTAPSNFGRHIKTCNPDLDYATLTCLLCNTQCVSKLKLYTHYARIHKRKICDQCGKSFTKTQYLAEHIRKHMNPEPYTCDLCESKFRSKDQVETHMLKRHMAPTCYCTQCDPPKPFAKELQLRRHIKRVHLKVKTIQCPECPHLCKNECDLKKHLLAKHTAPEIKNQFPCDECDFVTSTEAYLRKHKLTHLPDELKPFKCQYCNKGFSLQYDLERHEMSHNGIRPYSCKVCFKGFIKNNELKQHFIAQHTDDRPFICEICSVGHKDRWAYRNHLTAHERQMGITLDKSVGKFMAKYKDLQL